MGEGDGVNASSVNPHPFFMQKHRAALSHIRAFTPVFDGLWGEGAFTDAPP
jgi:hypothetical protein